MVAGGRVRQLRGLLEKERDAYSPAGAPPKPYPRLFFWGLVLVLGLMNVWARRNDVTPDSISYIEIGWATARGGLHQLVNAYWSPLYPFLLSLVFRFFHLVPEGIEFAAGSCGRTSWKILAGSVAHDVDLGKHLFSVGQLLLARPGVGHAGFVRCRAGLSCHRAPISNSRWTRQLACICRIWGAPGRRLPSQSSDVPSGLRLSFQRVLPEQNRGSLFPFRGAPNSAGDVGVCGNHPAVYLGAFGGERTAHFWRFRPYQLRRIRESRDEISALAGRASRNWHTASREPVNFLRSGGLRIFLAGAGFVLALV